MKVIKISIHPVRDEEVVSGTLLKQRNRGGSWTNDEVINFVSDQPDAERVLLLEDDQRLVIDGTSNRKTIMDGTQSAAVSGLSPPPRPIPRVTQTSGDDDDFSPSESAAELSMRPDALSKAQLEERRLAAITAARQRLKGV